MVNLFTIPCLLCGKVRLCMTHAATSNDDANQRQVEAKLRATNEELERLVASRTAELSQANEFLQQEIREHQQRELALLNEQAKLSDILNSAFAAIIRFRVFANHDWEYNYFSQGCESFFGYTTTELMADKLLWMSRVHPEDKETVIMSLFEDLFAERPIQANYRFYHKDGSLHWISSTYTSQRDNATNSWIITVVNSDITQSKQTELALRQSEARFRALTQTSSDIITISDAEGDVFYQSPSLEKILGYEPAAFLGKKPLEALHPEDLACVQTTMANILLNPGTSVVIEYRLRHKNGEWIWLESVATNSLDDPDIGALVILSRNISDRKKVEEALRESEARYRSVIAAMREGIVLQDAQGSIFACNASAERILGLTREQIIGRASTDPSWHTIHEDGSPFPGETHPAMMTLRSGQPTSNVVMGIHKPNREITWILINSQPLLKPGETTPYGVVTSFSDITRRKEAELALRESELSYRTLTENVPAIVYRLFLERPKRMVFFNKMVKTMFGCGPEDLNNQEVYSIDPLILPEDKPKIVATLKDAVNKNQPFQVEYRVRDQGGKICYCWEQGRPIKNADGQLLHIDGVIFDITERKLAESKIHEQAALLNITTDAICVRDLEHRILYWNQGAENLYGFLETEVMGKNANKILYKDGSHLQAVLKTVIESGSWQGELTQVKKDGTNVVVASRWTLMRDEAGQAKSFLTVNTDITEKKQLEAQFYRAQRLESLGTLASGIAHDLNNILTPILAVAQLLPLKLKNLDENSLQMLKMQETNVKRAASLVQQILSFARGAEGKRTYVQLENLLSDIERVAKGTFPKYIAIEKNTPDNLPTVVADSTQIHQVLMNLVVNARDAMLNGGTLSISAETMYIDENYAKMNLEAKVGDYVVVTITDTGVGMTPEIIDRIFDPFFTTKDLGQGTGLGLSTAMGIIKNHGGFVNVFSEVGKGSKFQVFLPVSNGAVPQTAENQELPKGHGELILLVDDEEIVAETTKSTLETHNYRVLTASDGIDAIAIYAQQKNEISVVLTDMMMPMMDGENAIRTLQKLNPLVKIIAMSGLNSTEMIAKAARAGVKHFLPKPFTAEELLNCLHGFLNKR